jgi:TolB-like protein/tetratricopeptide (TPR) repeat protein
MRCFATDHRMRLFNELKRRNVFRVGAAYLLLAWILIQVTDTVSPALNLPVWTLSFVIWIAVIGFPIALLFAWAFELTPDGLKREKDVNRTESITYVTGKRINNVVLVLMAIAIVFLVADRFLRERSDGPASGTESAATSSPEGPDGYQSIGVLPFVNMSDDPSQEYFSDGIAEELLNALAKLKSVQVAARTSSFAFKGKNQDITEIGSELNVETVLEGSVRKSGNRLRITAQLIDVSNGYHLWSETYDRELSDIFAIQDEITEAIVEALLVHFEAGESVIVAKSAPTNMSAYDAYLQGRHHIRQLGNTSLRESLRLFRAATDADPEFAPAWAARAWAVIALRETDFIEGIPAEEARLLARANIDRALAIDPELPDAYFAEAILLQDNYRYDEALASLEKALAINPNLAEARVWRSRILGRLGRVREAKEDVLKALELDPHNAVTAIVATNLAVDFYDPAFFEAIATRVSTVPRARLLLLMHRWMYLEPFTSETYRKIVELPNMPPEAIAFGNYFGLKEIDEELLARQSRNHGDFLMWTYMHLDQWDKAMAMYDALPAERQESVLNLEELSIMLASQGKCQESIEALDRAHGGEIRVYGLVLPNNSRSNPNLALNRLFCLRAAGNTEDAADVLNLVRAYVETLRENATHGYYVVDAKLRILEGDIDGALGVMEDAKQRRELGWNDRYDPILRTIKDEPRFKALFEAVDREIDALRAELGMPPASI